MFYTLDGAAQTVELSCFEAAVGVNESTTVEEMLCRKLLCTAGSEEKPLLVRCVAFALEKGQGRGGERERKEEGGGGEGGEESTPNFFGHFFFFWKKFSAFKNSTVFSTVVQVGAVQDDRAGRVVRAIFGDCHVRDAVRSQICGCAFRQEGRI